MMMITGSERERGGERGPRTKHRARDSGSRRRDPNDEGDEGFVGRSAFFLRSVFLSEETERQSAGEGEAARDAGFARDEATRSRVLHERRTVRV